MSASFTLHSAILRGLLNAAGKSDVRFYLNGIFFDTEKNRLVATDGTILLVSRPVIDIILPSKPPKGSKPPPGPVMSVAGELPQIPSFIMPRTLVERALKLVSKKAPTVTITVSDGTPRDITLEGAGGSVTEKEIDGRYPQCERVIPLGTSGENGQYDPQLLASVQAGVCFHGYGIPNVTLQHNGTGAAIMTGADPNILGVVMPWRAAEGTHKGALETLGLVGHGELA